MLADTMIEAAAAEFKQMLTEFCTNEQMDQLTPALAERIAEGVKWSLAGAGVGVGVGVVFVSEVALGVGAWRESALERAAFSSEVMRRPRFHFTPR